MADASSILSRIRSFGANVLTEQGKLIVVNREKLPTGAMEVIKQHSREIAALLDREADFEERAAIVEYDGGLNRSVAEYLTRLLMASPPEGAESDWSWFVGHAAKIIDLKAPRRAA